MPLPDRDEMDVKYRRGLSLGLISPSPPHGQDTRGCHQSACIDKGLAPNGDAPLSSELRHCTAYPELCPEATWAQPLGREELS
jgi:hypothetical protein